MRDRRDQSDGDWARHIMRAVWCSRETPHGGDAFIEEVSVLLAGRYLLDRMLATGACTRACDAARLADAFGSTNDRVCGDGLCICAGGLSANLDMPVARDTPAASFGASGVLMLGTVPAHQSLSGRLFGAVDGPITDTALVGMPDATLRALRR